MTASRQQETRALTPNMGTWPAIRNRTPAEGPFGTPPAATSARRPGANATVDEDSEGDQREHHDEAGRQCRHECRRTGRAGEIDGQTAVRQRAEIQLGRPQQVARMPKGKSAGMTPPPVGA